MRLSLIAAMFLLASQHSAGQRNEILNDRIASLQVVAGDDWLSMPVVNLDGSTPLNISFDDLTHDYTRYCYKLIHCEADWTPSDQLFASDYCEGFSEGNTIDDISQSINTNTLYTHYRLSLPNPQCRMKMSGNYKLVVYDGNDEDNVAFTACFMVVEPVMGVGLGVVTNTDVDVNNRHQQVEMDLRYNDAFNITDYRRQIKTVVLQNGRWDNAVWNSQPQYVTNEGLRWQHCRQLIFPGGNEYRKFEMLDMNHTTMGLENIHWDGRQYQAYVWTDEPRKNYVYDEDANGAFYIRNSDNVENDVASDYALVHFRLMAPPQSDGIYLNGVWTNDWFVSKYKLEYNQASQSYEVAVPLKQGYYSYQYLSVGSDGKASPLLAEGNFYQTENTYQALVYYRGNGDRTDRLVGYQNVKFKL
ncbi:MAG: DUF5103 domain-containing protein [Prevotella sp.]|nr:DUF5103 domain-containing protein [Bacteroidales bacterium]MDY4952980.1 DUF5103 domain-containing protein [Prevotella sp.]MCI6103379.1 DUF5103 domain-containing protein [Bacteroidales bacterium]MCI7652838.1 DUF5103 domain-containing protein [Bacteroidales bacterium]MDD7705629.1 DUF5103 domain-containing protein [Bacteroidales bacterium]